MSYILDRVSDAAGVDAENFAGSGVEAFRSSRPYQRLRSRNEPGEEKKLRKSGDLGVCKDRSFPEDSEALEEGRGQ